MINSFDVSKEKIIKKNLKACQKEIRRIFIDNRKNSDVMLKKYNVLLESSFFKRLSTDIELTNKEKVIKEGIFGDAIDVVDFRDNIGAGAVHHAKKVMIMGILNSLPPVGPLDFTKIVNNKTNIGQAALDFFANLSTDDLLLIPKIFQGKVKSDDKLCERYLTAFGEAVTTFFVLGALKGIEKAGGAAEYADELLDTAIGQAIMGAIGQIRHPWVRGIAIAIEGGIEIVSFFVKHLTPIFKEISNSPLGYVTFESIMMSIKKDLLGKIISFLEKTLGLPSKICGWIDSFYVEPTEEELKDVNPFLKDRKRKSSSLPSKTFKRRSSAREKFEKQRLKRENMSIRQKKLMSEDILRKIIRKKLLTEGSDSQGHIFIFIENVENKVDELSEKLAKLQTSYSLLENNGVGLLGIVTSISDVKKSPFSLAPILKESEAFKVDLFNFLSSLNAFLRTITGGRESLIKKMRPKGVRTIQKSISVFLDSLKTFQSDMTGATIAGGAFDSSVGFLKDLTPASGFPQSIDMTDPGTAVTGKFTNDANLGASLYHGVSATFSGGTNNTAVRHFGKGNNGNYTAAKTPFLLRYYNDCFKNMTRGVTASGLKYQNAILDFNSTPPAGFAALINDYNDSSVTGTVEGNLNSDLGGVLSHKHFDIDGTPITVGEFLEKISKFLESGSLLKVLRKTLEHTNKTNPGKLVNGVDLVVSGGKIISVILTKDEAKETNKIEEPQVIDPEEDEGEDEGEDEDGGGSDSGDKDKKEKSKVETELDLADEQEAIRIRIEAQTKRMEAQRKQDQLQKQIEYESDTAVEARQKAAEEALKEMSTNPAGIISFPVGSKRIAKNFRTAVFAPGVAFDNTVGIEAPNIQTGWASRTGKEIFDAINDGYRNIQYLVPLVSSTTAGDAKKSPGGKVLTSTTLDNVSAKFCPSAVNDTGDATVKRTVQKMLNDLVNMIKPSRIILKQPFKLTFRVTGIFDAYTRGAGFMGGINDDDLILVNNNNTSPSTTIPAGNWGKFLPKKEVIRGLNKSTQTRDKRIAKNFGKMRFVDLSRNGSPIDEGKIKIKVEGAMLGMIRDNIFAKDADDLARYVKDSIIEIIQREFVDMNVFKSTNGFVSVNDFILRGFSSGQYSKGLLMFLDSIDFTIMFDPGEFDQTIVNESKMLSEKMLRRIIKKKLIKEATSKQINFSEIFMDGIDSDLFDKEGYQDDLNNLVIIKRHEQGKTIEYSDNKEDSTKKAKGCSIYTVEIKKVDRYEDVTGSDDKKTKKAIPSSSSGKEYKIAFQNIRSETEDLNVYVYEEKSGHYVKVPDDKMTKYIEIVSYGTPDRGITSIPKSDELKMKKHIKDKK